MKSKREVVGQPAEEDKSGGVEQLQHRAHPVVESGCMRQYVMILQCAPPLLQGQSSGSSLAESCGTAPCQCSYLQF